MKPTKSIHPKKPIVSTRLIDILSRENATYEDHENRKWLFDKFVKLIDRIEARNPSIDDLDLRWVERRILRINEGMPVSRDDVKKANELWRRWK